MKKALIVLAVMLAAAGLLSGLAAASDDPALSANGYGAVFGTEEGRLTLELTLPQGAPAEDRVFFLWLGTREQPYMWNHTVKPGKNELWDVQYNDSGIYFDAWEEESPACYTQALLFESDSAGHNTTDEPIAGWQLEKPIVGKQDAAFPLPGGRVTVVSPLSRDTPSGVFRFWGLDLDHYAYHLTNENFYPSYPRLSGDRELNLLLRKPDAVMSGKTDGASFSTRDGDRLNTSYNLRLYAIRFAETETEIEFLVSRLTFGVGGANYMTAPENGRNNYTLLFLIRDYNGYDTSASARLLLQLTPPGGPVDPLTSYVVCLGDAQNPVQKWYAAAPYDFFEAYGLEPGRSYTHARIYGGDTLPADWSTQTPLADWELDRPLLSTEEAVEFPFRARFPHIHVMPAPDFQKNGISYPYLMRGLQQGTYSYLFRVGEDTVILERSGGSLYVDSEDICYAAAPYSADVTEGSICAFQFVDEGDCVIFSASDWLEFPIPGAVPELTGWMEPGKLKWDRMPLFVTGKESYRIRFFRDGVQVLEQAFAATNSYDLSALAEDLPDGVYSLELTSLRGNYEGGDALMSRLEDVMVLRSGPAASSTLSEDGSVWTLVRQSEVSLDGRISESGGISCTVSSDRERSAVLAAASFDGGRLADIELEPLTLQEGNTDVAFPNLAQGTEYRFFLLDAETFTPLCSSVSLK